MRELWLYFLVLASCSADLYHGPEKAEFSNVDKDDFVGRHYNEAIPKFITRVVNPDEAYIKRCKKTIDSVAELMRSKLVRYKVASTVKGGSLGKGTAVKDKADADLLFVLNGIESVKELRVMLPEILTHLQSALDRSDYNVTAINRTPFTIQFQIEIGGMYQDVDLLPIIDLKVKHPTKENLKSVYKEIRQHEDLRDNYFKCLSFLQVNVVKQVQEKVKKVIRLLKYWIKTKKFDVKLKEKTEENKQLAEVLPDIHKQRFNTSHLGKMKSAVVTSETVESKKTKFDNSYKIPKKTELNIPTKQNANNKSWHVLKSYGAELLVIKAFEELGSDLRVSEKDLIMKVFKMLSDLKSLKVSWDTYYDPKSFKIPSAPYILDPAFPYHNLMRQKTGGIDDKYKYLERDAEKILLTLIDQDY